MIVEYIRYRIDAARAGAFVAAYGAAMESLLGSPWCLGADLARCVDDPAAFILRIEWTSADDHMVRFRGSAAFRTFLGHIRPYVGDIEEMRHYERIPLTAEA